MRLMSSAGSLLIDMLNIPTHSKAAGEALIFLGIQIAFNGLRTITN